MNNLIVNKYLLKQEMITFDNGTVLHLAENIANGVSYFIKAFKGGENSDAGTTDVGRLVPVFCRDDQRAGVGVAVRKRFSYKKNLLIECVLRSRNICITGTLPQ